MNSYHSISHVLNLATLRVECVGPVFGSQFYRTPPVSEGHKHNLFITETIPSYIEPDKLFYKGLDPKIWKEQDHYAVLGLNHLRFNATDSDIKKAYHIQLLRHHPDKLTNPSADQGQSEYDYFVCITKAWEVLGNPRRRRSYDSVDSYFDDSIPCLTEYTKNHFYDIFGKTFELNARWSEKTPVPQLGGEYTPKDEVLHFYSFWYNFVSWREFSYLDEEVNKDFDRKERKCLQKINKLRQAKRKKEEMARIRKLVDTAYSFDPRILQYKKEEQDAKEVIKQAKKNAAKLKREEEECKTKAIEDALTLQKKRQEEEEKERQNAVKAERAVNKQALKKARSGLRKLMKENNYYSESPEELVKHMTNMEKLCKCLDSNELNNLVSAIADEGYAAFLNAVVKIEKYIINEVQMTVNLASTPCSTSASENTKDCIDVIPWTQEEIQLLKKAVTAFPPGTNQRWENVSNYLNHHRRNDVAERTPKEVLLKVRELQSESYCRNTPPNNVITQNLNNSNDDDNAQTGLVDRHVRHINFKSCWTAAEQELLENALKMFPASTPDRWDKVAVHVSSKTKRECMKRFKDIAEMLRLRTTAQNIASA